MAFLAARRPTALERAREVYVEDSTQPGELEPGFVHPSPP